MAKSSIFGKDKNSFTYRNIQKTAKEFVALDGIETVFGNNPKHLREGLVLRVKDDYSISFKAKSPEYSL